MALNRFYPISEFVGEHDAIEIRVVMLVNSIQRQALVVVDQTSLTLTVIARMKAILAEIAGVTAQQAIVCASHNFSTPKVGFSIPPTNSDRSQQANSNLGDTVLNAFIEAMRTATQRAVATLQPARLGAGSGYSRIGANRNVETPYGYWLGADDKGFSDPYVGVLRIDGHDGRPLAILMNYAVQPAVMDASQRRNGGRLASADFAGAACRHVEAHYGGNAVVMYLLGSGGDQVPYLQASRHEVDADGNIGRIDIHEDGFVLVDLFGQRLGDEVIKVSESIDTENTTKLSLQRYDISVPSLEFSPRNMPKGPVKSFDYISNGTMNMPVILFQWGELAVIGVQPEFSAIIGVNIRNASPYAHTFVVTMADGGAKYLPDISNYDNFTYEARNSPFDRGAAEIAVQAIVNNLLQMKDSQ